MKSFSQVRRTLFYVEWFFIIIYLSSYMLSGSFSISLERTLKISVFFSAIAILSLIFPVNRPYWQRQGYICLGIFLLISANLLVTDINFVFFLYIAKSCFLLNRKGVLLTVVFTGMAYAVSGVWSIPELIKLELSTNYNYFNPKTFLVSSLVTYLSASTFVILLSYMVIAEQKSRSRAETLAQQVEALAATLERTRIARDIHDSLGHTLTSLQMQLVAAQRLRQHDLDKSFQATDTAKLLADQSIEDISRSLHTIRQPMHFDLNQALSTLMEQMRQNPALSVQWKLELPQLPLQMSHQIYYIVKEGLNNIQKHACASQIRLQGKSISEGILLELEDNGQGFAPEASYPGFGLKGMKERVQLMGGKLTINSVPGSGTRIQTILPL